MNAMNWFFFKSGKTKVNEIESTSRWFQTGQFPIVVECGRLHEIEVDVNLLVHWKKEDSRLPNNVHSQIVLETYL